MNLLATCPLRVLKEVSSFSTRVVKPINKIKYCNSIIWL